MTVSYINLMRAQQRPHPIPVEDRTFTSGMDILAAGRAVRARLMGSALVSEPEVAEIAPAPVMPVPPKQSRIRPQRAPINMIKPCSAKFLLRLAALRHQISEEDIAGPSRTRGVVAARVEAMCLIYQHTQWSLPQVGRFMGRDHTTVLHALRKSGVVRKQVDMTPNLASVMRPKRVLDNAEECQSRDIIHIPPTAGFIAGDKRTIQQIIGEVCEQHGVSELELHSPRRADYLVIARHEAIYRLSKEAALTNREIGQVMGGKDPSLVSFAIRSHEARRQEFR